MKKQALSPAQVAYNAALAAYEVSKAAVEAYNASLPWADAEGNDEAEDSLLDTLLDYETEIGHAAKVTAVTQAEAALVQWAASHICTHPQATAAQKAQIMDLAAKHSKGQLSLSLTNRLIAICMKYSPNH